jgi:hypothetical protein
MLRSRSLVRNAFLMRMRASHSLQIGDVDIRISKPLHPEIVPNSFASELHLTQDCLGHLRWLTQKDSLHQDCFLIGPPGSYRRRLALAYAELTGREVEVLVLSQDTTEADLKQRREIVNGSAIFVDQAPVRAAIEVLVSLLPLVTILLLFVAGSTFNSGRNRKGREKCPSDPQQSSRK